MLSLDIKSPHYRYLLQSYKEYLTVLGYAAPTVQSWPIHVREFLHYLEKYCKSPSFGGVGEAITSVHLSEFITYIERRSNKRKVKAGTASVAALRGGGLSSSSINKITSAVSVFIKFLNATGRYVVETTVRKSESSVGERTILSVAEIKQLYEATFLPQRQNSLAMGQRDRAIIAIFYGCGLRRSEGRQLDITDIDLQKRLLFVRKGKGGKQRYVPIAARHLQDIRDYLEQGRDWFLYHHGSTEMFHSKRHGQPLWRKDNADGMAFFINMYGERMQHGFDQRIKQLQQRAEIEKNVTLHGLRHSIATHLLQSGMEIEEIAKFLGHASLASTQIYTHIINEHDGEI